MNKNTKNILSNFQGSNEDWIDEYDAPELTGSVLYHPCGEFYVGGFKVNRAISMVAFGKKFREVYAQQKQTTKVIHVKQRTQQPRLQIAQMRQLTRMGMMI